jgi:hypothetical protein
MTEQKKRVEKAVETAAEYEMRGSLAADQTKREEYRTLAKFHRRIADELRQQKSTPEEFAESLAEEPLKDGAGQPDGPNGR